MSTVKPNFIDLFVSWFINGEEREPQDFARQDELAITTDGKQGEVEVKVKLEGIQKILQNAEETVKLLFQAKEQRNNG